jgi:hypothetical protein
MVSPKQLGQVSEAARRCRWDDVLPNLCAALFWAWIGLTILNTYRPGLLPSWLPIGTMPVSHSSGDREYFEPSNGAGPSSW